MNSNVHRIFQETSLRLSWVIFIAFFSLISCEKDGADEASAGVGNQLTPAVEAVKTRLGSLPLTERLTGVVRAINQVSIRPQVNAIITAVYVKNGDVVRKGDPLVQLRDTEFQEQLKQAKANYQIAVAQRKQADAKLQEVRNELKRTQSLADKGLASSAELDQIRTKTVSAEADLELAEARITQAQASIDERQESLSQTVIRAPVSGSVGNRNAEIGLLVSAGTQLFTLGSLDSVRVNIILTDRMLAYIKEGQRTEIRGQTLANPISVPLSRISPFLHPVTHSTDAEIEMANPDYDLKPGMFVTVDVFYGESEQATLVPLSALYENPSTGVTGVYVSSTDLNIEPAGSINSAGNIALTDPVKFRFVPVDVIARGRMEAGISSVEPGSWVITLGQDLLAGKSENARVRPVKWNWVEELQQVQRQDMLDELMQQQSQPDSVKALLNNNTVQ